MDEAVFVQTLDYGAERWTPLTSLEIVSVDGIIPEDQGMAAVDVDSPIAG